MSHPTPTLERVPAEPVAARRLQKVASELVRLRQERDDLIREMYDPPGTGPSEIARLAGLSHAGVLHIVTKKSHQNRTPNASET